MLVAIGLAAGLVLALALGRIIASQLFGIAANDPGTFTVVGLVLASVALIAAALPALRATRIDALIALRQE